MSRLVRGPLCLPCMGAWESHMTSHTPCRGVTVRLGRPVRCRCQCQDDRPVPDVIRELPPQPAARVVPAAPRRRSYGPVAPGRPIDPRLL